MARLLLGTAVGISPRGAVIVQANPGLRVRAAGLHESARDAVKVGAHVVDARRERVGRVSDVIGPVKSPMLIVQPPRGAKVHRFQGKELYVDS